MSKKQKKEEQVRQVQVKGQEQTMKPVVEEKEESITEKVKSKVSKTFERWLRLCLIALSLSTTDTTLITAASTVGYTQEKIAVGIALGNELERAYETQKRLYAEQVNATQDFVDLMAKATETVNELVDYARLAFKKDPAMADTLGIYEPRQTTIGEWFAKTKRFYNELTAVPSNLDKMAAVGITPERIDAGRLELDAVIQADNLKQKLKGDAQNATKEKLKKHQEFAIWMSGYRNVMKTALKDNPQMMEKLGIITR
ncbi:MAG: hypothetical protein GY940_29575 [bacterium]|nr:hypothetical protein [bacterium]